MDRVKHEEVRGRVGIERELADRVGQRVLRWFWSLGENVRVPHG